MKNLRTYVQEVLEGNRFVFFLSIGINLLLGLTKSASLVLLVPIFEKVAGQQSKGGVEKSPFSLENLLVFDSFSSLFLSLFVLICLQSFLKHYQSLLSTRMVENFLYREKESYIKKIMSADWLYFKREKNSKLYHSFLNQIDLIAYSITQLSSFVENSIMVLVFGITLLLISLKATLVAFLCLLPLLFFQKFFFRKSLVIGEKENELKAIQLEQFENQVQHIREIKLSSKKKQFFHFFLLKLKEYSIQNERFAKIQNYSNFVFDIGVFVIFTLIFYVSFYYLKIPLSYLLLFLFVISRMASWLNHLTSSVINVLNYLPVFNTYCSFREELNAAQEEERIAEKLDLNTTAVEIKNLSFSYRDKIILNDFSCTFLPQRMNVLIGESGCGKTTLLELMLNLLKPASGAIYIDGQEIGIHKREDLYRQVAYVPQQVNFLNGSIFENLCFMNDEPDRLAVMEEMEKCEAFSFLGKLPYQLETLIGENGFELSSGERQRLAIFKALLKKPKLLILDEATANIDEKNERLIFDYLKKMTPSTTIIYVTHRPYLWEYADHSVYM